MCGLDPRHHGLGVVGERHAVVGELLAVEGELDGGDARGGGGAERRLDRQQRVAGGVGARLGGDTEEPRVVGRPRHQREVAQEGAVGRVPHAQAGGLEGHFDRRRVVDAAEPPPGRRALVHGHAIVNHAQLRLWPFLKSDGDARRAAAADGAGADVGGVVERRAVRELEAGAAAVAAHLERESRAEESEALGVGVLGRQRDGAVGGGVAAREEQRRAAVAAAQPAVRRLAGRRVTDENGAAEGHGGVRIDVRRKVERSLVRHPARARRRRDASNRLGVGKRGGRHRRQPDRRRVPPARRRTKLADAWAHVGKVGAAQRDVGAAAVRPRRWGERGDGRRIVHVERLRRRKLLAVERDPRRVRADGKPRGRHADDVFVGGAIVDVERDAGRRQLPRVHPRRPRLGRAHRRRAKRAAVVGPVDQRRAAADAEVGAPVRRPARRRERRGVAHVVGKRDRRGRPVGGGGGRVATVPVKREFERHARRRLPRRDDAHHLGRAHIELRRRQLLAKPTRVRQAVVKHRAAQHDARGARRRPRRRRERRDDDRRVVRQRHAAARKLLAVERHLDIDARRVQQRLRREYNIVKPVVVHRRPRRRRQRKLPLGRRRVPGHRHVAHVDGGIPLDDQAVWRVGSPVADAEVGPVLPLPVGERRQSDELIVVQDLNDLLRELLSTIVDAAEGRARVKCDPKAAAAADGAEAVAGNVGVQQREAVTAAHPPNRRVPGAPVAAAANVHARAQLEAPPRPLPHRRERQRALHVRARQRELEHALGDPRVAKQRALVAAVVGKRRRRVGVDEAKLVVHDGGGGRVDPLRKGGRVRRQVGAKCALRRLARFLRAVGAKAGAKPPGEAAHHPRRLRRRRHAHHVIGAVRPRHERRAVPPVVAPARVEGDGGAVHRSVPTPRRRVELILEAALQVGEGNEPRHRHIHRLVALKDGKRRAVARGGRDAGGAAVALERRERGDGRVVDCERDRLTRKLLAVERDREQRRAGRVQRRRRAQQAFAARVVRGADDAHARRAPVGGTPRRDAQTAGERAADHAAAADHFVLVPFK